MNLHNVLYLLILLAVALASYYLIEIRIIDIEKERWAREEEVAASATDDSFDYQDGDYIINTGYDLPNGGYHEMDVSFTFSENKVTKVKVVFDKKPDKTTAPQKRFMAAMTPLVIGRDIDNISLSRVGGSSLTTNGFNDALAQAKAQAKS